jgi:hypothetical protein
MPNDKIAFTSFCFCKQNNNDSRQILTYWYRSDSHWMCPTQASHNIVGRAQQLATPSDSPEAVYHDPSTGKQRLITATQIATFL